MSTTRVKRHSTNDLMDDWLESQGYYRKHVAKDSSCLFRAVSEQLFNTQVLHMEVRIKCADYMEANSSKFSALIDDSFENYITTLRNPKEWGGQIEIMALSFLYNCDFSIFQDVGKSLYRATNNNHEKIILLCQTSGNHYDSVYPKSFIQVAAISQSIVYEILYKKVFALGDEVDFAVETMLHDKVYAKSRKDSTASVESANQLPFLEFGDSGDDKDPKAIGSEIRQALARGFPPFPYKVAKALDPDIYRNVEFDVWNESKKGEIVYEPGVKCLVRLDKDSLETFHAHIQEVLPDTNSVTLYIVELGKKQIVPIDCLEPLPTNKNSSGYNISGSYYQKHVNGTNTEFENFKTKKKLFKKSKFKELQFSVSIPRGQSIPPRFQPQQQQHSQPSYNSVNTMGREREGITYQGINKYRNRSADKYTSNNVGYVSNGNHNYRISTGFARNNEKLLPQPSNFAPTAVTWAKPNGPMASAGTPKTPSMEDECSDSIIRNSTLKREDFTDSMQQLNIGISPSPMSNSAASAINSKSITSTPSLPNSHQFSNQDNSIVSSPMFTSPQPVAIYPYQCFGVCLPLDSPIQSINYGTPRSREPNGSDLPLHDLATLRFFYNLGHDYFRSSTIIPVPNNHYQSAILSYNPQLAYQTIGGYGTPISGMGSDGETISSPSSDPNVTPPENSNEILIEGNTAKEFYEPAYYYDVSAVNLLPNIIQPAIDYSVPPPPIVHSAIGDFKGGLVVNEQGVLALNVSSTAGGSSGNNVNNQPNYQQNTSRFRSDSGGSNRSQRSNSANWHKNSVKSNNINHSGLKSKDYISNQSVYQSSKLESSPGHVPWSHRYQQRISNSKPTSNFYPQHMPSAPPALPPPPPAPTQQPIIPVGSQPPPTFSMMSTGSPIMTAASPTSLGVFTGISHGSPTTYYGSPPTTALIYPQTHIPYMTTPPL